MDKLVRTMRQLFARKVLLFSKAECPATALSRFEVSTVLDAYPLGTMVFWQDFSA